MDSKAATTASVHVEAHQPIKHQIVISLDVDNQITVTAPFSDRMLCYGMLGIATGMVERMFAEIEKQNNPSGIM